MTRRYKVLVVDDDIDHVTIVRTILEQHGYDPLEAFNGEEALELVKHTMPDLILLDIMMPKMDGLEVIRRLKEDARTRDLPVIMFSAKSGTREIMESFNYGASNYLIKPIDTERLLEKVETTLKKEQFRESLEKRYRDTVTGEEAGSEISAQDRGSVISLLNQFLTTIDTPMEVIQSKLNSLGLNAGNDEQFRKITQKLDGISSLCEELKEIVGDSGEV